MQQIPRQSDRLGSVFPRGNRLFCAVATCGMALVVWAYQGGWNHAALAQEAAPAATTIDRANTPVVTTEASATNAIPADTTQSLAAIPGEPTLTRDQRLKRLMAGVSAVGGILILGVLLIVFALVSSRRLRRLARAGRQPASRVEEFWYLKHPLPAPPQPPSESFPTIPPPAAPPDAPPSGGSQTDSPPPV